MNFEVGNPVSRNFTNANSLALTNVTYLCKGKLDEAFMEICCSKFATLLYI